MTARKLLLLLAIASAASPATAEPCGSVASRYEIAERLRLAAENRPVNVTFLTTADGVRLPDYLKQKFPDTLTIILQYEFERLTVKDDRFDVILRFKGRAERLTVPFSAIREFWDRTELKCSER
jgi:hypothetical protein